MLLENQFVEIKWKSLSKNAKQWYTNKGYIFSKNSDTLTVQAEDLSPSSKAQVSVKCDYCEKIFQTQYSCYYNGIHKFPKSCCSKCTGKKSSEISHKKRAKKYWDKLEELCNNNDYVLITKLEDYTDLKMQIEYMCPYHGLQKQMLDNVLRGHLCFDCSYKNRFKNITHSSSYVKHIIENVNNNIWLNENDYINCTTHNLLIKCGLCNNNIFETSLVNYQKHNVNKCRKCSSATSSGEKIIEDILNIYKINYIREKRFIDCKDEKPLPFDFYLPCFNSCIEFDGQGHYKPIYGEKPFIKTILHDAMKNNYCRWNNIKLIRIPYWEGSNIRRILTQELNLNYH